MAFRLAERGVLRRFEGRWRLVAAGAAGCELLIEQEARACAPQRSCLHTVQLITETKQHATVQRCLPLRTDTASVQLKGIKLVCPRHQVMTVSILPTCFKANIGAAAGHQVQPKWAPRPLRRRMRYALIAFCEFLLREMRDEAARVAAGRPAGGPRACDGVRLAEAAAAALDPNPKPSPGLAPEGKTAAGAGARPSFTLAAAAGGVAAPGAPPATQLPAPCQPLKRAVTFASDTRGGGGGGLDAGLDTLDAAPGAPAARLATQGAHRRVHSITALCLVGAAGGPRPLLETLGGFSDSSGGVVRRTAHSAPRLGRARSLPAC